MLRAITSALESLISQGSNTRTWDLTGCYDAFTFTTLLQFEDYGWCKKGEGKDYVTSGTINLGGKRPNNTSGGHLCEGYTHGMNMVIEKRSAACEGWPTTTAPTGRTASTPTTTPRRGAAR